MPCKPAVLSLVISSLLGEQAVKNGILYHGMIVEEYDPRVEFWGKVSWEVATASVKIVGIEPKELVSVRICDSEGFTKPLARK